MEFVITGLLILWIARNIYLDCIGSHKFFQVSNMTTLIDKLESIRQDMWDEESECLQVIKHSDSDYYGSASRKLIELANKRAVIKEAINSIKAFSYHYRVCQKDEVNYRMSFATGKVTEHNDRDEIDNDLRQMFGE